MSFTFIFASRTRYFSRILAVIFFGLFFGACSGKKSNTSPPVAPPPPPPIQYYGNHQGRIGNFDYYGNGHVGSYDSEQERAERRRRYATSQDRLYRFRRGEQNRRSEESDFIADDDNDGGHDRPDDWSDEQTDYSRGDKEGYRPRSPGAPTVLGQNSPAGLESSGSDPQQSSVPYGGAPPSVTGTIDPAGNYFTDSRVDVLLPVLKAQIDKIPEPIRQESEAFSLAINSMGVQANVKTRRVLVEFVFDGPTGPVSAKFAGFLDRNNRSVMYETHATEGDEYPFSVTLACVDADMTTCENTIVRIDQFTNKGEICKTAFVVHRVGNAHVTFNQSDYHRSLESLNPNFKEFMLYLKNTSDAVKKVLICLRSGRSNCATPPMRAPGANDVEFRSWAAAYGRSSFVVSLWSVTTINNPIQDALVFSGPLLLADSLGQESSSNSEIQINGYQRNLNAVNVNTGIVDHEGKFARYLSRAQLLKNDGNGNILASIHFNGVAESAELGFKSQVLPGRDFLKLVESGPPPPSKP
ncbi:MAG: hypothetical protein IPJ71_10465 [Bdellovibrionales bacterium]|nr:hypothetical protein [Bdellovibrionales bacterium]